jgi:hypothetical protein
VSSYSEPQDPTGSPARHRDSGHHRGGDAVDADAWAKRAPTLGNRSTAPSGTTGTGRGSTTFTTNVTEWSMHKQ